MDITMLCCQLKKKLGQVSVKVCSHGQPLLKTFPLDRSTSEIYLPIKLALFPEFSMLLKSGTVCFLQSLIEISCSMPLK
jgi:hypothetical protein